LILSANLNLSLLESDATWLVLVLNQNDALSVVTFNFLLLNLVQKLNLEFLIRLPVGIIVDADLDHSLLLLGVHSEKFVLLLVIFASLGCAVNGAYPESNIVWDLLLNGDADVAV